MGKAGGRKERKWGERKHRERNNKKKEGKCKGKGEEEQSVTTLSERKGGRRG